ncbi:MAG: histidine kinase N-terminal 7TM domain-containing protein [Patescibacteria group bacterium]|jgi:hypothetical protein
MLEKLITLLALFNLGLYLYILFKVGKRWSFSKAHRRFFILALLGLIWLLAVYLMTYNFPIKFYRLLVNINFSVAPLIAGFFLSFIFHFPRENKKLTIIKEFAYFVPLLILFILSYLNVFIYSKEFRSFHTYHSYYWYLGLIFIYLILISGYIAIKKYKKIAGIPKMQLRYIITGYLIALVILFIESLYQNLYGAPPVILDRIILNSSIIFSIFAVFAFLRYRFLDVRVIFKKGTLRLASYLILFAIYLLIVFAIKDSISLSNKVSESTFLIISTLVIVITIEPFRYLIYKGIDKIFESHEQKLDLARKRAQVINFSQTNFETLNNQVMAVIKDYSEVKAIRFIDANDQYFRNHFALSQYLKTTDKILIPEELAYREEEDIIFAKMKEELAGEEISCFVPIGYPDFFAGAYALAPRSGQKAYTVQDIEQLRQFQSQFTNAILNAKMYQMAIQRITKN